MVDTQKKRDMSPWNMEDRRRVEKGESQLCVYVWWKKQQEPRDEGTCYPLENIKLPKTRHEPLFLSLFKKKKKSNKFLVLKCTPRRSYLGQVYGAYTYRKPYSTFWG